MWPNLMHCIESDSNIKSKLSCINSAINVHCLKIETEREIAFVKKKINEFCGESPKRAEGILLLYAVVHCHPPLYIDNWHRIVESSLKCPDSVIAKEIPLNILNNMIINFGSVTDYTDAFSKLMNDVLSLLSESDGDKIYKLSCQSLAHYMKYLPEIAGSRINEIEEILVKELNNPYGEVIEAIGDCFAALPTCLLRYHKTKSIQYKEIWCNLITKFINTMHLLLNNLMNLSEDQPEYVDVSNLPLFVIPSSDDIPISQIDTFKSLCQCMAKVMSSESGSVRLPITDLLEALFRIFQVENMIKRQNETAKTGYFILGFPQMLYGAYVVFEALILNFHILDQSHNFWTFIRMSLEAMEEKFSQSSVDQMRGSTWKLVNVWLKHHGPKGSYGLANDMTIIQKILLDIDIDGKHLKPNNREEKSKQTHANKIFACTHALKVLKSLCEFGCSYIEISFLEKISSPLLRISKVVVRHVSPQKIYPFPYSSDVCRKMLFDVIQTFALFCDPSTNKCMIEANHIFTAGALDPSTKVTRVCHRFRKLSRYYFNPRKPPPEAIQLSNHQMLQQAVIQNTKDVWVQLDITSNGMAISSDMHVDDGEATRVQDENAHPERMEVENDLMPIEQETDSHMNHDYGRIATQSSQSVGEEESADDSDIEPTYISTDSNPQRMGLNDSSRVDSFGLLPCGNQYTNKTRTDRQTADYIVPNLTNNVENSIEHVSFVEKSAKKVQMENGHWKKEDNSESDEDESDMDEEGDEEGDANEENSAGDEASDGKRSPEFDEERPNKRQKFIDEEQDEEDLEDEDNIINNQSLSDEETEVNHVHVSEEDTEKNSEENTMENTVVNSMVNAVANSMENIIGNNVVNAMENEDENTEDGLLPLRSMLVDYHPQEAPQIS